MKKKKRFNTLKAKIILYTVVPVILSFVMVCILIFVSLLNSVRETAQAHLQIIGQEYAASFENKIHYALNYLSITASVMENRAGTPIADRVLLQETLKTVFDQYALVDGSSVYFEPDAYDGRDQDFIGTAYGSAASGRISYYFYTENGKSLFLPYTLENDQEFKGVYYTRAREYGHPVYSDPSVYEIDGREIPMFTLSYPMYSPNEDFLGVVTVDLFLEDLYTQLQSETIYSNGYIIIANDRGQVIYSPLFEQIGSDRADARLMYPLPDNGEVAHDLTKSLLDGRDCIVTTVPVYIPVLDSHFYMSVVAPTSEIYANGMSLIYLLGLLSLFVIIVVSILVYFYINRVSSPLRKITESANRVANGYDDGLTQFNALDENEDTMDEVSMLHDSIRLMLTQLDQVQRFRIEAMEMKHEKEKAESQVRAKTDFLAKMSHEIRTPMNAIIGMSELILRRELPQDIYENALGIKSASANLLSIINDILDFSKIESGKLEIIEVEYPFASLINDVVSIIRMRLMEKQVRFTVNVDCHIPAMLTGDEVRIRQIFLNLLSNAVKYTQEGFIALTIRAEINEGVVVLLADITDSGVGIKDEDMDKLFGDFVQIDMVKNKEIEGTGLGLAIARNLCRAMGGDITVRSKYGYGSTFSAKLPQRYTNDEGFARITAPGAKRTLIYEPRKIHEQSIMQSLEDLGVDCFAVETVSALYDELENCDYVFAPSFLFDSIRPVLDQRSNPPALVLLADIREHFAPKNARVLTMPAHALSLANIYNHVEERFAESFESDISFIAPDAKILVVDDINANLKVAEGLMAPYEMQIDTCRSGREAVEKVQEKQFDLVFMDHMMPEMDGIEATGVIRGMEEAYFRELPIIALTANAMSGVKEMFVQHGMNDFLAKPIETAKLDSILKKWIPAEKRKHKEATEVKDNTEEDAFLNALRVVPELSVGQALTGLGGSTASYTRIVAMTARLLPENISKLNEHFENDLNAYAIEVHGVKSVLNNIGAYTLGETALMLENFSKANDQDACHALHPSFMEALSDLSIRLNKAADAGQIAEKPTGDRQAFTDALPAIAEAVSYYDSVLALEHLSTFTHYAFDKQTDETIASLTEALEQFDFDRAAELLASFV